MSGKVAGKHDGADRRTTLTRLACAATIARRRQCPTRRRTRWRGLARSGKGAVQSFQGGLMAESDKVFAGSIPKFYDTLMVPLIFEAYAADLAELVAASSPGSVLETAAWSRGRLRQDSAPTRATW